MLGFIGSPFLWVRTLFLCRLQLMEIWDVQPIARIGLSFSSLIVRGSVAVVIRSAVFFV